MVILFLKQMWFVLSLNRYAQMAVLGQEPAQETDRAAKCETTARGFASSFKDQGVFFVPPRLEANTMHL